MHTSDFQHKPYRDAAQIAAPHVRPSDFRGTSTYARGAYGGVIAAACGFRFSGWEKMAEALGVRTESV